MELNSLNIYIAIISVLAIVSIIFLTNTRRRDVNKAFTFEVFAQRGMIIMRANNHLKASLGFEAHFYPSERNKVDSIVTLQNGDEHVEHMYLEGREHPMHPRPRMQQYFGKRVYTFTGVNTDTHHLDIQRLGQQLVQMSLQDRLTVSDNRVKFDMSLIHDMLFGFDFENLEVANHVYSPEMYNSMISSAREFNRINAGSFRLNTELDRVSKVNFKWIKQAA
ncbi:hypothetical protein [Vibrio phage phiKT1019]|nr:hypothetical protein [Vibrio phage phiKT1019]